VFKLTKLGRVRRAIYTFNMIASQMAKLQEGGTLRVGVYLKTLFNASVRLQARLVLSWRLECYP
jgi:hypothetical protein